LRHLGVFFPNTIEASLYRIPAQFPGFFRDICRKDLLVTKRRIGVNRLPSLLRFVAVVVLLMSVLPARAQQSAVRLPDIYVTITEGTHVISIHVLHKIGAQPNKVPVLLIHGTWGNAQTWDFPGRSVMDYLAVRGYDVYALDLRGMGGSDNPGYDKIEIPNRVNDAAAVANYLLTSTGRKPVVMGWSGGGVVTEFLAASDPQGQLLAGVGLLSVAPAGFNVPLDLQPALLGALSHPSFTPSRDQVNEIVFGTDPITGKPTISSDALTALTTAPYLQADSVKVLVQETELCPVIAFFIAPGLVSSCPVPALGNIHVPALVVDGALDLVVGEDRAQAVFNALGSTNKQLVIFPRNSHGWFLEDNDDSTMRVFDRFLSQF
jgi:pimeloyl-ACP methyl ester carboxylesterase